MFYKTVPNQDMTKQVTIHSVYGNYTIRFLPQYMQYFFTSHTTEHTVLLCSPPTPQSNTPPCIIWCNARQIFEIFQIDQLLLSIMSCGFGCMLLVSFHITIFIFISITKHLPISVIVLMMPCTTDPSFTSSTKSSAYCTVRNSFPAIWKSLNFQQHLM